MSDSICVSSGSAVPKQDKHLLFLSSIDRLELAINELGELVQRIELPGVAGMRGEAEKEERGKPSLSQFLAEEPDRINCITDKARGLTEKLTALLF